MLKKIKTVKIAVFFCGFGSAICLAGSHENFIDMASVGLRGSVGTYQFDGKITDIKTNQKDDISTLATSGISVGPSLQLFVSPLYLTLSFERFFNGAKYETNASGNQQIDSFETNRDSIDFIGGMMIGDSGSALYLNYHRDNFDIDSGRVSLNKSGNLNVLNEYIVSGYYIGGVMPLNNGALFSVQISPPGALKTYASYNGRSLDVESNWGLGISLTSNPRGQAVVGLRTNIISTQDESTQYKYDFMDTYYNVYLQWNWGG